MSHMGDSPSNGTSADGGPVPLDPHRVVRPMTLPLAQITAFQYVTAEKAQLYRSIMRVFMEAKTRFALHLRPADVSSALADKSSLGKPDLVEVERALAVLCDWGNLEKHLDTAEVATVEEFLRPRYLYRLTQEGQAAQRAIQVFEESIAQPGELQTAALGDIRDLLRELQELSSAPEPDAKVQRTLTALCGRFDELTGRAQTFISSLHRTIELQGMAMEEFLAYKQRLIDYLEKFINELVIACVDIAETIERIESFGVDRLLDMAATRELIDAVAPSTEHVAVARDRWRVRWQGLRGWFIGDSLMKSQAEELRAHARSAIPVLLRAVLAIHDRRTMRSDRTADLRTLARWFAETDSEGDAHRLWRAAFGLTSARHLRIDSDSLDTRAESPVPPSTSWLEAEPLRISPRLRRTGRYTRRGRIANVILRQDGKAELAALAEEEARQIATARDRLASGRRIRLAEMSLLNPLEFDLFLDLLGEALSKRESEAETVEAYSTDGSLRIVLEPIRDGAWVVIPTSIGQFAGRDHYVEICGTFEAEDRRATVGGLPEQTPVPLAGEAAQ
ncbi:MAG: hypothetical protein BIFFINMI_00923 [Phycisphaerae bacterium]|nr:hypothetical protein [Phycisphaerae bacterium]